MFQPHSATVPGDQRDYWPLHKVREHNKLKLKIWCFLFFNFEFPEPEERSERLWRICLLMNSSIPRIWPEFGWTSRTETLIWLTWMWRWGIYSRTQSEWRTRKINSYRLDCRSKCNFAFTTKRSASSTNSRRTRVCSSCSTSKMTLLRRWENFDKMI